MNEDTILIVNAAYAVFNAVTFFLLIYMFFMRYRKDLVKLWIVSWMLMVLTIIRLVASSLLFFSDQIPQINILFDIVIAVWIIYMHPERELIKKGA